MMFKVYNKPLPNPKEEGPKLFSQFLQALMGKPQEAINVKEDNPYHKEINLGTAKPDEPREKSYIYYRELPNKEKKSEVYVASLEVYKDMQTVYREIAEETMLKSITPPTKETVYTDIPNEDEEPTYTIIPDEAMNPASPRHAKSDDTSDGSRKFMLSVVEVLRKFTNLSGTKSLEFSSQYPLYFLMI